MALLVSGAVARRSRLIYRGSLSIPSFLQSHNPLIATQKHFCAVGVVTTRLGPQSWRISALAGHQGRLRACTQDLQRHHSQPVRILVTTSIIKSDGVPGLRPGAASLFSGGSRLRCCRCARSAVLIVLYVVTIFLRQRPLRSDGTNLCSLRTGADVSPLQGRAFSGACPQVRRRTGYIFI